MNTQQDYLQQAFAPESFRKEGHLLIDQLADWLQKQQQGKTQVISYRAPEQALEDWQNRLDKGLSMHDLIDAGLQESTSVHHPAYMGHQISPPVPVAALAGLVGDLLNNGMGVYEMGMAGTATERVVVEEMAKHLGFDTQAGGFITSGGTLANLTALLTARACQVSKPVWMEGSYEPLAVMVSEAAHYCVDRAVRIMGWGEKGVISIPVDENFQMRTELLAQKLADAQAKGIQVVAVIGSACTTATGSFDDLNAIADFCEQHQLWFHVDGAHGAALAFSEKHRFRVAGIERADSLVMDFHKMLLTPSITTLLLYRKHQQAYASFQQRASYLMEWEAKDEWYNLARRTFECTKLMTGFKVYSILATHGTRLFEEYVSRVCLLGEAFAKLIQVHPSFELACQPQCNIICFRYRASHLSEPEMDGINRQIRQKILEEGHFYIVQTVLGDRFWLRTTLTNPFTSEKELSALLQYILQLAGRLVKSK